MAYQPILDSLGDPTRRAVFELLRPGPRSVGALAQELPVSRPAVSQHLKVLKEAGLVLDRQEGTRRIYEVVPDGLREVASYIGTFWAGALEAFGSEVERAEGGESP